MGALELTGLKFANNSEIANGHFLMPAELDFRKHLCPVN